MTNKKNNMNLNAAAAAVIAATMAGCGIFTPKKTETAPSPENTPIPKVAAADPVGSAAPESSQVSSPKSNTAKEDTPKAESVKVREEAPKDESSKPKEETSEYSKAVAIENTISGNAVFESSETFVKTVAEEHPVTNTENNEPKSETAPVSPADVSAPVLMYVPNNITTKWGESPDLSEIIAIDESDGQVEVRFVGLDAIDVNTAGIYPAAAVAVDKAGNTAKVDFTITVLEEDPAHKEYRLAQKAVANASAVVETKKQNVAAAKLDLSNAQSILSSLNTTLKTNYAALNEASKAVSEAKAKLEVANKALEGAEDAYNTALANAVDKEAYDAAKAILDQKTADLEASIKARAQPTKRLPILLMPKR